MFCQNRFLSFIYVVVDEVVHNIKCLSCVLEYFYDISIEFACCLIVSTAEWAIYTVSQTKVPTFKFSVTLSNLNRFSKYLHCWKAYEICYKTHTSTQYPPHLRHFANCYTTLGN